MANATITGTASNFGSISGVLSGEAGQVAGSVTGIVIGTLGGSVGVPGPSSVPTVQDNGGGYNNGQFSTVHYPKELVFTVNGTHYAVPARIIS